MRHRPLIAGAVALALTCSLAACGDDGDDEASTETTEATTEDTATDDTTADDTEAEEPETTEAPDDTTDDTEAEAPAGDLSGFLLTAEDLGAGFAEQEYETSEDPGPCGTTVDADHPYDAIVGTVLVDEANQLGLQHEIRSYADAATAGDTLAAAQEAFSCGASTNEEGLVLSEVTDLSADLEVESAFAVQVTSEADGTEGAVIAALVGPTIAVFQFVGPADSEEGPDVQTILVDNLAALQAEVG